MRLNPQAYRNYECVPKIIDLAKLIESGELISNNLHIKLTGLDGGGQFFYVKDDIVILKLKSNLPLNTLSQCILAVTNRYIPICSSLIRASLTVSLPIIATAGLS